MEEFYALVVRDQLLGVVKSHRSDMASATRVQESARIPSINRKRSRMRDYAVILILGEIYALSAEHFALEI